MDEKKRKDIKEFTEMYYPDKRILEREALINLCWKQCNEHTVILNTLLRHDIKSIKELHETSVEDLNKMKGIGPKRMSEIIELKNFISSSIETTE